MKPTWFKPRGYMHFDAPVWLAFALGVDNSARVSKHAWSPLIHYVKRIKRYKAQDGKTGYKDRPIMYASHRDACILSKYAADVTYDLDAHYNSNGLSDNVIAYRRLGKSNYHFSADAYRFAKANAPCVVLCFDITGFFDHLDHRILKDRLKRILTVTELSNDWYAVFHSVTRYSKVSRDTLAAHRIFGPRLRSRAREPLATIAEIKADGIAIERNSKPFGIPQGTPISSAFSNVYMIDVDMRMAYECRKVRALYQRYSDDILIVCFPEHEDALTALLHAQVAAHKLEIKAEKIERANFDPAKPETFQYLGFNVMPDGAVIRPSSLARQWRKAKHNLSKTKKVGEAAIAKGTATRIYTKKLRRRFNPVGSRNFSSYARRSAKAFGSKKIVRQILRLVVCVN